MDRKKSYFIKMREFHNDIKRQMYEKYTKNIHSLLEIAVGKCGDLSKWERNNIKKVRGYDIDEKSIKEGKRRVKEYNGKCEISLNVLDLGKNEIEKEQEKYDVVSAQFSFHYFFKSKETFEKVMESIDKNIRRGGYFIGTLFDGQSIQNMQLSDKNDIKFKLEIGKINNTEFGNEVKVEINSTVLNEGTIEYIVNFDIFKQLMKEHGYDLIESKMFRDLYNEKYNLNDINKKVSFLNRTFVFKRTFCEIRIKDILSWCPLKEDIINYNERLNKKYKQELLYKFNNSNNSKTKERYKYIIDNFDNIPNMKTHPDFKYMKKIYDMYYKELM